MLIVCIIVFAALAAYTTSFDGEFILDDYHSIAENRYMQKPFPAALKVIWHPPARAVTNFTLLINYKLHGTDVRGYHAVNLAVHLAAALALYGVVRRILLCGVLRQRFGSDAQWLALITALLWVAHPLQTQSVTYLIQRAESLMGLCLLFTVYAAARGFASAHAGRWYCAATAVCAIGVIYPLCTWINHVLSSYISALRTSRLSTDIIGVP